MRKNNLSTIPSDVLETSINWLPLDQIASIEVVSEDSNTSITDALLHDSVAGWRAEHPGKRTIRLSFDSPRPLKRIWLLFIEREVERSQEFVLRWSADNGETFQEIVRQQWNFSPSGSTQEAEDYHVELPNVAQLELTIVPDRNKSDVYASLAQLRLA